MAEALYRKYRPIVFDDVVGQKHILTTLKNAITNDKLSHAYLFCGPRGTGKTTMARLMAKACLCAEAETIPTVSPCGKCKECTDIAKSEHPDVYELDAASRTGVDNVREEIIGRVGFAATRGTKKIYIIDEVHMLSTAAFNALLKTLEEPPSHVIFVLCTTDPQKVPDTILSRCQRFDFKAISVEDIADRLSYVCDAEGIEAESAALIKIAENAQGAMRNALTQLEQLISYSNGKISVADVTDENIDLTALFEALSQRDLRASFDWVENYCETGADFENLTFQLTKKIRDLYIEGSESFSNDRLHRMMVIMGDLNTELKTSPNARLSFEIAMARIARPDGDLTLESLAERISDIEEGKMIVSPVEVREIPKVTSAPEPVMEESFEPVVEEEPTETHETKMDVPNINTTEVSEQRTRSMKLDDIPPIESMCNLKNTESLNKAWHAAFASIKKKYPAYGAILITATPAFNEETNQFVLEFPESNEFAINAINKPDTMSKIHQEIKAVVGDNVGLDLGTQSEDKKAFEPNFTSDFRREKKDVKDILSNFGATDITEN
ncbi:MAG: DNA polymerase III subunit gamma/tau [Coriobacteriia bacterium]|nr:DNA polymerase III subunit gamma/tau [Coriobacteriia bacterium]